MLLYLVLWEVLQVALSSHYCYQCATNNAIMNWSGYGLPMRQGDAMVGDNECFNENAVTAIKSCKGVCVTVNVTIGEGEKEMSIAVVRECHRKSDHVVEILNNTSTNCITREFRVKRRTHLVKSCYCATDYCNGVSHRNHKSFGRSTLHRRLSRPDTASLATLGTSLILLTLFWL